MRTPHLSWPLWGLLALQILSSAPAFAGEPERAANLSACKGGWSSCDRPRLTLLEMTEVTRAGRARNVASCRSGLAVCDRSRLSGPEAIALAVALYDRNVASCRRAAASCDRSRLTELEERELGGGDAPAITDPAPQREAGGGNLAECMRGSATCDHSLLSRAESFRLASAENARNHAACRSRRGYCDRSRLTPSAAAAIPLPPKRTP